MNTIPEIQVDSEYNTRDAHSEYNTVGDTDSKYTTRDIVNAISEIQIVNTIQ